MQITKTNNGGVTVVSVNGSIDAGTAPQLEAFLKEETKADKIVLDLAKVEYVSSAGLRVFLTTHKAMAAKGGFVLKNVCNDVLDILKITGFSTFLTIE